MFSEINSWYRFNGFCFVFPTDSAFPRPRTHGSSLPEFFFITFSLSNRETVKGKKKKKGKTFALQRVKLRRSLFASFVVSLSSVKRCTKQKFCFCYSMAIVLTPITHRKRKQKREPFSFSNQSLSDYLK